MPGGTPSSHRKSRPPGAGAGACWPYHESDWLTATRDLLSDRGLMGDGVIGLRNVRGWMEAAGYSGQAAVEIFSKLDWWQREGDEVLATCIERHRRVV